MYSPLFKKYCCGPNIAESLSSIHAYLLPHKKGQIFSSWLVKGDAYVRVCFEHHLKGYPVLFLFYFFQFSGRFKYKVLRYNNKVRISNNSQVKASSSVRNNASVNSSCAHSLLCPWMFWRWARLFKCCLQDVVFLRIALSLIHIWRCRRRG